MIISDRLDESLILWYYGLFNAMGLWWFFNAYLWRIDVYGGCAQLCRKSIFRNIIEEEDLFPICGHIMILCWRWKLTPPPPLHSSTAQIGSPITVPCLSFIVEFDLPTDCRSFHIARIVYFLNSACNIM